MTQTKQTFPVRLDVEFTDEMIIDHISGGGAFGWEWWYSVNRDDKGYTIEAENPNGDEVVTKFVSFDGVREAMAQILAGFFVTHTRMGTPIGPASAYQQIMDGVRTGDFDIDSDGADQIMQIAVFGRVIYG